MLKEIIYPFVKNKAKEYGSHLLHNNVKEDLDKAYYVAQGLTETLTPTKRTLAKNALDFCKNSIFEITTIHKQNNQEEKKKQSQESNINNDNIIDAEFKVRNVK